MRTFSQLRKTAGADRKASLAPAERKDLLSEAELERIAAAGGSSNGSLNGGGNLVGAAEWPPPPRLN